MQPKSEKFKRRSLFKEKRRFVSFRFVSFRFASFRFVSFRFVSFRFVSCFGFRFGFLFWFHPACLLTPPASPPEDITAFTPGSVLIVMSVNAFAAFSCKVPEIKHK
eukprot:COSAG06_NODE_44956_length_358_cov_73.227799_1_plen_105_part_10